MQRILITGATGLVGQEIVRQCHAQNIAVNYLSTRISKLENKENYKGYYWNPATNEIDVKCFEGTQVIINLAGVTVSKRWSKKYKQAILDSRTQSLELLYSTIKKNNIPINSLISASGISIYPSSRTNYYDETFSETDDSFLAKVTAQWETKALKFETLKINVALLRIGLVLSNLGGALPKLLKPIKSFVGAPLGKGGQWQSWIHIEDLAGIFLHLANNNRSGVFNAVAPNPVKQRELTRAIAKISNRPIIFPNVPSFILKILLGEMSVLVLDSQRVSSKKIESLDFQFKYHHLEPALINLLKD